MAGPNISGPNLPISLSVGLGALITQQLTVVLDDPKKMVGASQVTADV